MENIKKAFVGQVKYLYWCYYYLSNGFLSYKKICSSLFNEIFHRPLIKFIKTMPVCFSM
ncbi:hypothetical protein [Hathewaya massiliensis]|uniref:hypothetical protein n=1 Tax=Hathewaya massiliensis TaxID=1964382 RepID=UPI00163C136B|nr:hypothetical protein [Hathewaya massiliensis]